MCFVRAGHVTPSSAPTESDDQSEYFTWQCGIEAPHRSVGPRGGGRRGEGGGTIARAWEKRPPRPSRSCVRSSIRERDINRADAITDSVPDSVRLPAALEVSALIGLAGGLSDFLIGSE